MLRGGDAFDSKEVVDGKVAAGFPGAISDDGVVKDLKFLDGRGEVRVDKGVKIGVKGLKDRDRTLICCPWFINEGAAGGFEGFWKET